MPTKDPRDAGPEVAPQATRGSTPGTQRAAARRRLDRRKSEPEHRPWQSAVVRVSTVIAVWLGY